MSYADLVSGETVYELNECSCGGSPYMVTIPNVNGGMFYAVKCMRCSMHTPTVYGSAAEAENIWNGMVKREGR